MLGSVSIQTSTGPDGKAFLRGARERSSEGSGSRCAKNATYTHPSEGPSATRTSVNRSRFGESVGHGRSRGSGSSERRPSGVFKEAHKAKIHGEVLVAVKQGKPGVVGHEIHFDPAETLNEDGVFNDACGCFRVNLRHLDLCTRVPGRIGDSAADG